jgi:hypothetical protein
VPSFVASQFFKSSDLRKNDGYMVSGRFQVFQWFFKGLQKQPSSKPGLKAVEIRLATLD